ncbi:MAG: GatB/YqeY domain-containing protein [Candidatus Marinimicrobia bacterium]|nr:GatB/YqeY domain-containing protein [Candidatus Neomarinimicrobiota bacterium]MBT4362716.1 GatB/YqeY domain-containing protein [Candidatus Neomarinimicrobiota bacterium]MBT4713275.1 GatB/YqeY domain-containing protein [Candidatus Neomarinimicrobiota bacterium]MBT4944795.1 GatB/YqeY domain-containing protein [Candidatus Neomarinimicrobiota bacterium]MBT5271632.1 GatB/YqeY domain-containing protein [Candidatus Neomarinimicrobiota bacterium]
MDYRKELNDQLKVAMKAKDATSLKTIRDLKSRIQMREIEKGEALKEAEIVKLVQTAAKQRKEAIALYEQGDRPELVAAENAELQVLKKYLPQMMDETAMEDLVKRILKETGAVSMGDMGKVMGPLMKAAAGKADGKRLQEIVKGMLSS